MAYPFRHFHHKNIDCWNQNITKSASKLLSLNINWVLYRILKNRQLLKELILFFFFPLLFSNVLVLSLEFLLNLSSFFWMAIGLDRPKGVWSIYSQCLETWDNWVTSFVPPKMYYLVLITCSPYSLGLKGFSNMTQLNLKSTK